MFYRQCNDCNERWQLGTASTCKCPEEPEMIYPDYTPGVGWRNVQPPAQRKPLTDEELNLIGAQWHYNLLGKDDKAELFAFARAIEAKLRSKNEDRN